MAKATVTITRTKTRTKTNKIGKNSGGSKGPKRCPTCGRYV